MILPVTAVASQQAVQLVKHYSLSHGLGLPDALIAAIALETEHTLVTGNVRDFVFIEHLHVMRPPYRPQPSQPA